MPWIPTGVEFERRFAERLADNLLNIRKGEGNTILSLLGEILAQRGKTGIRRHILLLGRLRCVGLCCIRLGREFH